MKRINILLVDDEKDFLNSISKSLEVRDFEVVAVERGERAVEEARNREFDIVLLDLKMPGLNGEQTLKILKKEHSYLEIVILTGHGAIDSAVECTKEGAYSYLQKPCSLEEILEVLTNAYKKKVMNKEKIRESRMNEILKPYNSPRDIINAIRKLDGK